MVRSIPRELKRKLQQGTISRRQFMQNTIAAGVTLSAATSFADRVEAATPKKGGTMRVGVGHGATSDILDPGIYENNFVISTSYAMNGFLTQVGVDGSLEPSVADSWEGSADASTWTFKIRKGVEFHNGKTVTADDVIASINHHRGEGSTSVAGPLLSAVTDVRADGTDTVVVELEAGNADFPFVLTDYHIPVQPAKDGKMDWQARVGCGAYSLQDWQPGIRAEFHRNTNHWTDEVGHVDVFELLALLDTNARTSALVSGDVDAIDKVDFKTAGLLGSRPGINIHSVTGTQHYTFPMRTDRGPYDNADVRRALKHIFKREELVEKILFGYGEVGNDHPIGSGQRYFNKDLPQTPYDPDKAKFFLKRAGVDSLALDLSAADAAFAGAVDAAVLIQNSAKAAGIDINVVREPNDGYWGEVWMNKDWCACYWGGRPIEDMMFSTAYETGAAWNDSFWSNERFDMLLREARAELDDNKRREMYYEMQAIVNDDGGVAVPMYAAYVFATKDNIGHGDQFASNWDMDGSRYMERWWMV